MTAVYRAVTAAFRAVTTDNAAVTAPTLLQWCSSVGAVPAPGSGLLLHGKGWEDNFNIH